MRNLDVLVLLVVAYGCSDAFLFGSVEFKFVAQLNCPGMFNYGCGHIPVVS